MAVFAIVGDTGGDDISDDDNPKDDTRIERIKFAPAQIALKLKLSGRLRSSRL